MSCDLIEKRNCVGRFSQRLIRERQLRPQVGDALYTYCKNLIAVQNFVDSTPVTEQIRGAAGIAS